MYCPKKLEWVLFYSEIKSNFKFYSTCYPLRCQLFFYVLYVSVSFFFSTHENIVYADEIHSRQLTHTDCVIISEEGKTYWINPNKKKTLGVQHYENGRPDVGQLTLKIAYMYAADQGIYTPYSEIPENASCTKEYFGFPKFLLKAMHYEYRQAITKAFAAEGLDVNKDPIGQALLREGKAFFDNLDKAHPMYIEEYLLPNGDIFFRAFPLTTHPVGEEFPSAFYTGSHMSLGVLDLQADGLNEKDIWVAGKPRETWIQTTAKHFVISQECKEWVIDHMVEELISIQSEVRGVAPEDVAGILKKKNFLLKAAALSSDSDAIINSTPSDFRIIAEEKALKIPECIVGNTSNTSYKQNIEQVKTIEPTAWKDYHSFPKFKSPDLTPNHGLSVGDCSAFNKINVTQFKTIYTMFSNKINGIQFSPGTIKTIYKTFFS